MATQRTASDINDGGGAAHDRRIAIRPDPPDARRAAGIAEEIAAALMCVRWIAVVVPSRARYHLRGTVRDVARGACASRSACSTRQRGDISGPTAGMGLAKTCLSLRSGSRGALLLQSSNWCARPRLTAPVGRTQRD